MTRLTDEQHAAIATVWHTGGTWQQAAASIGVVGLGDRGPSAAVRAWFVLIDHQGGWRSTVWCRTCTTCGHPLVARQPGQHTHSGPCRRQMHAQLSRRSIQRRGYTSTEHVKRWRAANPGRNMALRIRDRFAPDAHADTELSPEQRAAHSRTAIASRRRLNDELRPVAGHHALPWTETDDRWLLWHQDFSAGAAALALGRTASSVLHRRGDLRKRGWLPARGQEPVEVGRGAELPSLIATELRVRGWSATTLAGKIGVAVGQVYRWMRPVPARLRLSDRTVARLAGVFEVPIGDVARIVRAQPSKRAPLSPVERGRLGGRMGGLKGGPARAATMTREQRQAWSQKATSARWGRRAEGEAPAWVTVLVRLTEWHLAVLDAYASRHQLFARGRPHRQRAVTDLLDALAGAGENSSETGG